MVVFDATVLIDLFNPSCHPDRRAKLDQLVSELERKKAKILIPTPALAEYLAKAGKARDKVHAELTTKGVFRIGNFDSRAALECALMLDTAKSGGDKRGQAKTWAKAKFDWQIIAISKVANAHTLYSEDSDLERIGARFGIKVIRTDDLPLPASARQARLDLPE
jgi:predicted nucleic acid-binding protein